jgi:hypothetical protein
VEGHGRRATAEEFSQPLAKIALLKLAKVYYIGLQSNLPRMGHEVMSSFHANLAHVSGTRREGPVLGEN